MSLTQKNKQSGWDSMGKVASSLCAIHCALCAFIPSIFSLIGLELLMDHEAEWAFTIVAILFAIGASVIGWLEHKNPLVLSSFGIGILALFASRFLEESGGHIVGVSVGIIAGLVLFGTHLKNSEHIRKCRETCCD